MKAIKKIAILTVAAIIFFAGLMGGCNQGNAGDTPDNSVEYADDINGGALHLFKDGSTNYTLVIPSAFNAYEKYASEEFEYFFEQSTTERIQTITDENLTLRETDYYISIGSTALLHQAGYSADHAELGDDGLKINTKGNVVFLYGAGGYGTLYAVYEFLGYHIGFHAYAVDEIYVDIKPEIRMLSLNLTNVPDFKVRMSGFMSTREATKAKDAARLRLLANIAGGQTIFDGPKSIFWTHSFYTVLPPSEYLEAHPEWYPHYKEGDAHAGDLCLTNAEMTKEFIQNTLMHVDENPTQLYLNISMMDTELPCGCDNCKQSNAQNGGEAGTLMLFINKVAKAVEEHLQGTGRTLTIYTLAYYFNLKPPVTYDSTAKTYTPVNQNVVARDNVMIMFAPIKSCVQHAFTDSHCEVNADTIPIAEHLRGWTAVCKRLSLYEYATAFRDYLMYFDNWGSMAQNYKFYKEVGVEYIFPLGNSYNATSPFQELRTYLQARLMWDTETNVEQAVRGFMDGYYKVAGDELYGFYTAIRTHYNFLAEEMGYAHTIAVTTNASIDIWKKSYWPEMTVRTFQAYLDRAVNKIEASALPESEKQILLERILEEEINVRYMLLCFYQDKYESKEVLAAEKARFFEDCARLGIISRREGTKPIALIQLP